ncbi:outer membrane beta-barrel protein [Sulfuriflexus mobilis]|uniref:outer membrane beta-barrel protein n=1 Tax=Sulfuriflexus mobilis TaxID=1811807 RepID=UPI000F83C4B2|nr:outer membrane beta-barrel protein [Sulfuriflexus mobilis]
MNSNSRAVQRDGVVRCSLVTSLLVLTLMALSTTVSADAPAPSSNADQDRILKELEAEGKAQAPKAKPAEVKPSAPPPAPAKSHAKSQWYVGASAGRTDYDLSESDFDAAFAAAGFTSSTDIEDTDTGYKAFVGWQFHKNFAVELGYVDLGTYDIDTIITAPVSATFNGDADVDGYSLSLVGSYPATDNFSVIGRLGAYFWDVNSQGTASVGATAVNLNGDDSGTDIVLGVGAQYDFNKTIGIRAEYEVYKDVGDEDDIDFLSAGIVVRF